MLERKLDISQFYKADFNFIKCTYPAAISFFCRKVTVLKQISELPELFGTMNFPEYTITIKVGLIRLKCIFLYLCVCVCVSRSHDGVLQEAQRIEFIVAHS